MQQEWMSGLPAGTEEWAPERERYRGTLPGGVTHAALPGVVTAERYRVTNSTGTPMVPQCQGDQHTDHLAQFLGTAMLPRWSGTSSSGTAALSGYPGDQRHQHDYAD